MLPLIHSYKRKWLIHTNRLFGMVARRNPEKPLTDSNHLEFAEQWDLEGCCDVMRRKLNYSITLQSDIKDVFWSCVAATAGGKILCTSDN